MDKNYVSKLRFEYNNLLKLNKNDNLLLILDSENVFFYYYYIEILFKIYRSI